MEFMFRGPPEFWDRLIALAEQARDGGSDYIGATKQEDPAATEDWRITFVGDPPGDGMGLLYIPDENGRGDTSAWMEIADRIAANT